MADKNKEKWIRVDILVPREERALWIAQAEADDLTLAEFVRRRVRGEAPPIDMPKVPRLLLDFRHVHQQPKEKDKTPEQLSLREFKKKDPARFYAQLQKMEGEYLKMEPVKRKKAEAEPDLVDTVLAEAIAELQSEAASGPGVP